MFDSQWEEVLNLCQKTSLSVASALTVLALHLRAVLNFGTIGTNSRSLPNRDLLPVKTARVRIIKHEVVPGCSSFEVRFADGRESVFFYWDDIISRRLRPEQLTQAQALQQAKVMARARAERDQSS